MVVSDNTDPGMFPQGPPPKRAVYFTLKDWAILIGVVGGLLSAAVFVLSLMYYDRASGEKLRSDFDHHAVVAEPRLEKLERADEKLEDADDKFLEALHRIEIRQIRTAPRHIRDSLPPAPEHD